MLENEIAAMVSPAGVNMNKPNHVAFFDTTLRDGEQSPGCTMHPAEKLRMAHQLAALGVDVLEAGFAIASMVLGIVWVYWVGSILAIIFGHISLNQIKRSGQGGKGMAIAGLVLGYVELAILVIFIIAVIATGSSGSE